ncbi:trophoblast glycoprotein [Hemicordylus capensis]|uniref:trophoblast glycoprotein n=1 Tax=Hemicordylus capensis TaxID=884348 RepID=UPI00230393B7|nr:trophoblast glycoprotein [Hemicordylus capensis]XP_053143062.1 trophoblast glycoprotein [Hemicordylus capensis]XP_053143063.1 trophoblast glycoprotein [Hemicordylus capensis]XP_053143064.1 trophoblast glycoprotein [Hemicordylus capensis]XP_053143065.1 trophoblast glycoprotein [Hemicordylus capensis]XP_053143066.1 trophoblast glycoprotein [Hemicordylus capensis]
MLGCSLWGSVPHTPTGERRGLGWAELLLLLLPVLSGWALAQQPADCPELCECSEAARTVKCVNKNLTEVPQDLPRYVKNLFLTGNQISSLPSYAFFSEPFLKLSNLNLSSNNLERVETDALAGLPSLKQLDLSGNPLTWLSPAALGNTSSLLEELNLSNSLCNLTFVNLAELFQGGALLNLKRLDLSSNCLYFLPVGMFSSLANLQHLDLHNNSLVSLRNVSFQSLHQLQSFNLSDNALLFLENSTLLQFHSLPGLTNLSLGHNPWHCDCRIEDLVDWLKESIQVEDKETLKCSSPVNVQDSPLVMIDLSHLNCPVPTDSQLQTSYVFLGIVLALIGAIFLLVLYLNRKGIKKWMYNIRDACRDHMEGYHYRYEINADPRLTNLSSNSDV